MSEVGSSLGFLQASYLMCANNLRREAKLCDIILYVQGRMGAMVGYPAHKLLLISASKYFKLLFEREDLRNYCHFPHLSEEGMFAVLDIIYGHEIRKETDLNAALMAAMFLQVDCAIDKIEKLKDDAKRLTVKSHRIKGSNHSNSLHDRLTHHTSKTTNSAKRKNADILKPSNHKSRTKDKSFMSPSRNKSHENMSSRVIAATTESVQTLPLEGDTKQNDESMWAVIQVKQEPNEDTEPVGESNKHLSETLHSQAAQPLADPSDVYPVQSFAHFDPNMQAEFTDEQSYSEQGNADSFIYQVVDNNGDSKAMADFDCGSTSHNDGESFLYFLYVSAVCGSGQSLMDGCFLID